MDFYSFEGRLPLKRLEPSSEAIKRILDFSLKYDESKEILKN
tara:strand:+ start:219 stop:344 length:126 start_codon:yes stop_codon:yes gene_type:complete